ncbi:hypothetical protein PENARI_c008G03465 [Penicillium arizonense]|uniref:Uncharacterized protein n=1 Tax=Penicillium arizonense TaxID=1835702 RepID=A0A1F5LJA5_PENAI|nr:hypothetical protein PENARI_c008G03465 [Penicillium arizonense]OGE53100.1 hypothetical protein PENARI_c008G03465 [Penicillium arizonense]
MEYENPLVQRDHNILSESCPWQVDKPQHLSRNRVSAEEGLQWGSDPSFCYHGFSCPIGTWTEERLVQNLMRNMASICTSVDIDFDISESTNWSPPNAPQKDPSDSLGLNGFTLPMFQPSTVQTNERLSETPSLSSSPSQGQAPSPENTTCTRRASCSLLQGNDALQRQLGKLKEQEKMNRLRLFPAEEDDQKLTY